MADLAFVGALLLAFSSDPAGQGTAASATSGGAQFASGETETATSGNQERSEEDTPEPQAPSDPAEAPEAHPSEVEAEEIVIHGRPDAPKGDPMVNINLASFEATQAVDTVIIKPIAKTYQRILPNQVRNGIRNFINNLREPVVFLNFLLQLKPGKAAETVGRFALNSTAGAAGLIDIAQRRPFKLPRRPNGLANTLGFYGIKPGPFLYIPLIGPTTVRDLIGDGLDRLVLPLAVGKPFDKPAVGIGLYAASSLDQRAEFDEKLEEIYQDSDPYARTREDYLASRQAAIDALHAMGHRKPPPTPEVPVAPATTP